MEVKISSFELHVVASPPRSHKISKNQNFLRASQPLCHGRMDLVNDQTYTPGVGGGRLGIIENKLKKNVVFKKWKQLAAIVGV